MQKLALIVTHPIQYYVPLFSLLQARNKLHVKVFYTWERGSESFDRGFGKNIYWDIPLLEGYEYTFVSNEGRMKRGFWDVRNRTLNLEIEQWGANAVLIFGWNYWSHLQAMIYFKGKIPVLFRGDSNLLDMRSTWKEILRKLWLSWVYRHVDYGIYVGTNNKKYYLKYGLQEKQLAFAPHAVDNDRFYDFPNRSYEARALILRNRLGYLESDTVLMFIGKLEEKKDPFLLLKSFVQIPNASIRLLYVGNGYLENELKKQAANDSRIAFMDFQNQSVLPIIYRVADIIVLPSKGPGETWGLAVNEAMACSRPILVSNKVGCAVDLVDDNNGYIFNSGDEQDLTNKIVSFITSKSMKGILGQNANNKIKNWSFDQLLICIENILQ